jgi:metal-responsive CopG/Arc/MetJ family transcriptional regulator
MAQQKVTSVGLPEELDHRLEQAVAQNPEVTKSQIIREGLRQELQKYEHGDH